jgi:hypothetical protein
VREFNDFGHTLLSFHHELRRDHTVMTLRLLDELSVKRRLKANVWFSRPELTMCAERCARFLAGLLGDYDGTNLLF